MLTAAVHMSNAQHQKTQGGWIVDGLERHGVKVVTAGRDEPVEADFAVIWGWRSKAVIDAARERGAPVLVMERGYIGDRFAWTSLGWDGLNGRARFPAITDKSRWEEHFAHLMKPWKSNAGYALIMGQVQGDAAIADVDIVGWYTSVARRLKANGFPVLFRQHPGEIERGRPVPPIPATVIQGPLEKALSGAGLVVTFNSNTGVDAVLAGVPTHSEDEGSMAWPVTAHDLSQSRFQRDQWAYRLAWTQWQEDEIRSGEAWNVIRTAMPNA